jgi:hypothetical protein
MFLPGGQQLQTAKWLASFKNDREGLSNLDV